MDFLNEILSGTMWGWHQNCEVSRDFIRAMFPRSSLGCLCHPQVIPGSSLWYGLKLCVQQFEIKIRLKTIHNFCQHLRDYPLKTVSFRIDTCHLLQCANCNRNSLMASAVDKPQIQLRAVHMYSNNSSDTSNSQFSHSREHSFYSYICINTHSISYQITSLHFQHVNHIHCAEFHLRNKYYFWYICTYSFYNWLKLQHPSSPGCPCCPHHLQTFGDNLRSFHVVPIVTRPWGWPSQILDGETFCRWLIGGRGEVIHWWYLASLWIWRSCVKQSRKMMSQEGFE